MNNLFYNQNYPSPSTMNGYQLTKNAEPVRVNSRESVDSFPTRPNSRNIYFHESEPIFYCKITDDNNYPTVKVFRYEEIKSTTSESRFATLEDLYKMKEELIDEWQHIWNRPATESNVAADGKQHPTGPGINEQFGSKPEPRTDVEQSDEPKPSIW